MVVNISANCLISSQISAVRVAFTKCLEQLPHIHKSSRATYQSYIVTLTSSSLGKKELQWLQLPGRNIANAYIEMWYLWSHKHFRKYMHIIFTMPFTLPNVQKKAKWLKHIHTRSSQLRHHHPCKLYANRRHQSSASMTLWRQIAHKFSWYNVSLCWTPDSKCWWPRGCHRRGWTLICDVFQWITWVLMKKIKNKHECNKTPKHFITITD